MNHPGHTHARNTASHATETRTTGVKASERAATPPEQSQPCTEAHSGPNREAARNFGAPIETHQEVAAFCVHGRRFKTHIWGRTRPVLPRSWRSAHLRQVSGRHRSQRLPDRRLGRRLATARRSFSTCKGHSGVPARGTDAAQRVARASGPAARRKLEQSDTA